jgi:hypothetical protein
VSRFSKQQLVGLLWLGAFALAVFMVGAFAVPRVMVSRVKAGENAAIAALINISEAENAYRERYREIGYAPAIANLSVARTKDCEPSPQQACMLEYGLARNDGQPFRGYRFADHTGSESPRASYTVVATPEHYGRSGVRSFCVIEHGVPRYRDLRRDVSAQHITREQCLNDFSPLP